MFPHSSTKLTTVLFPSSQSSRQYNSKFKLWVFYLLVQIFCFESFVYYFCLYQAARHAPEWAGESLPTQGPSYWGEALASSLTLCSAVVLLSCDYHVTSSPHQEGEAGLVHHPDFLRQGNLFVQDNTKKGRYYSVYNLSWWLTLWCPVSIGSQWHRYYCQFRKKELAGKKIRQVRFLPIGHQGNVSSCLCLAI